MTGSERFIVVTHSPLLAPSLPHRSYNSFIRAVYGMEHAITRRAKEYGYTIIKLYAYETTNRIFTVEYKDIFDLHHTFSVVDIS